MIDHAGLARWLDDYVAAWKSYDREAIAALFAADARYRYDTYDPWVVGAEAIADDWLADRDEAGSYDAAYEPFAIEGERAVAVGTSTYTAADGSVARVYDNCFVMRFDDEGRCSEFVEYYTKRPGAEHQG